jgi:hypothetical protein
MKLSITLPLVVVFGAMILAFGVVMPALADHGDEAEEVSHATTVHVDDEHEMEAIAISASAGQAEQMQALVALLTQLIELLQHQLELVEGTHVDDHDHEEEHEEEHEDEVEHDDEHNDEEEHDE